MGTAKRSTARRADQNEESAKPQTRLGSLAARHGAAEVGGDRDKVTLDNTGDYIIGRVAEIREFAPKKKGDHPQIVLYLDLPDGRSVRMNMNSNLRNKMRAELVGNFVAIERTGEMDTGDPRNNMIVYTVYDFGNELPEDVAALADDLPF